MAKPRLIILIRHGQSEGNKNREIHQTVPDHRVKLTPEGWDQAHEAGRRLRQLLRPDDTIQFFTSPYRRTRETTEGILSTLTSDDLEPSPYRRPHIKVYEEPRLREQDFGNFQPCSAEMERMWQERADYGHFFYRIPNGESAADAYDRISGFNESLWRQFGDDDFPSVCVLVTHGLMSRVFLMKWYHFTVEYFEDLRNINHCEFLIMRKQGDGKYLLENKLRTWSEMRRERNAATATKDGGVKEKSKDHVKLDKSKSFVSTRRWGGCPNGCNHTAHYKRRHDLDALRDWKDGNPPPPPPSFHRINTHNSSDEEDVESEQLARAIKSPPLRPQEGGEEDDDDMDALLIPHRDDSSPDGTNPSSSDYGKPHHRHHHLHSGRDFGGTYSGRASVASGSGSGSESEHAAGKREPDGRPVTHADAERLGDEPADSDCAHHADDDDEEDLDKAEEEDKSIRGSVY